MSALSLACGLFLLVAQTEEEWREQIRRMFEDRIEQEHQSEHYHITAGRITGAELKTQLESLFVIWKDTLQAPAPTGKLRVIVPTQEGEYKKVAPPGSLAHFDPKSGTLYGLVEAGLFANLAREGTDQFLHAALPKAYANMPAWLKDGLGLYFGSVDIGRDKKLKMNDVLTRENFNNALILKKLIRDRRVVPLRELVDEDPAKYEANAKVRQVQAWGVVWWLYASGQGEALQKLIAALGGDQTLAQAYVSVFGPSGKVDWTSLDGQCTSYWKGLKVEIPDREESGWLVGETEHYTIRVQKGTKNDKLKMDEKAILKDMKFKMELIFDKYALAFGFEGKLSKRPQMRLYKNRNSYVASGASPSSAAYYNSQTKELVGYEDSEENGMVFQIFCHEGCHQFFDLAFPGFYDSEDLPMWFSEGLADCFGSSEIAGRNLMVFTVSGVATWRQEVVKEFLQTGSHPTITELLDMGRMPFMQDGQLHYSMSWSFCHFLWNAPNQIGGGGKYKEVVIRLIEGFKNGRPKDEVYRDAFQLNGKPLDYGQLEAEWKAYAKSLRVKAAKR